MSIRQKCVIVVLFCQVVLSFGQSTFADGFLESVFLSTIQKDNENNIVVPLPIEGYQGWHFVWVDGHMYEPRLDLIPHSNIGKEALMETIWVPLEFDSLRGSTYLSDVEKSPFYLGSSWDVIKFAADYQRL